MRDLKAKDIMSKDILTLQKDIPVRQAAKLLSEKGIGGAPVVGENGKVIGIVTEADLIMQDVRIHFPTYLHLLDGFIFLQSFKKFEAELKKAVGARVEDVMTTDVICLTEDDSVEDIATLMVEKNISRVPIVKDDKLVGMVTKGDIVKAISRS